MSEQEVNNSAADKRVYTLSRPFVFEEEEYTKLVLDFDKLTGKDILTAERRFLTDTGGIVGLVKEMSKAYQLYIVAAAADVPIELLHALPGNDFSKVTLRAQDFLLR